MRAVPPPGLFEWPPDVHKRSQDTIPTIFGCKRAILQKCLFSWRKQRVFEGRVAKLRSVFPSEAATASHLDGNKLTRSLGNTPSALNEKQKKTCFLFFLLSSLFSLLSSLCPRSRQRSHQGAGWLRKGSAPKRAEGKNPKHVFFYFSLSAEGVLPKDRFGFLSPDGSRWRPQSEKG